MDAMIAALGTLAFLATLWLLVVVGAAVLEESGAKIAAALKGASARQPVLRMTPVRVRMRARTRIMRAEPHWRAAA
jgi:hypothetical protein